MKNKVFNTILGVNSVFQAISCLITPIAIGGVVAWLLTANNVVGPWIYVVLITAGVLVGLVSMITFLWRYAETAKAMREAEELQDEDTARDYSPERKRPDER